MVFCWYSISGDCYIPKCRSTHMGVVCKKAISKLLQNSQEKTWSGSLFEKVVICRPAALLKRGSDKGVFMKILRNFLEHLFYRKLLGDCFWKCLVAIHYMESHLRCIRYQSDLVLVIGSSRPTMKFFLRNTELEFVYILHSYQTLFDIVNIELQKISQWFISNKLSLNVTKAKYSFFHKPSKKDNIHLILPKLSICNNEIKRAKSIKFLGVFLDKNLTWKDHIRYLENEIAKNIVLLFRSKPYLTKKCLLSLYYSYIHTYISYANMAWGSTYISNLKKINSQQKHAIRIIFNKKSMKQ